MGIFNRVKSKSLKIFSLFILAMILTLGLSVSFQSLLADWTAPLANPAICLPGNPGCDAPLNVGVSLQDKLGGLWLNTTTNPASIYGLLVEHGKVGIGTVTPNNLIQVAGLINFNNVTQSTFLGNLAGNVSTGVNNTAVGDHALFSNTTGSNNTAVGDHALFSNTTGSNNTANGPYSLYSGGSYNTANGYQSLYSNTSSFNTANGYQSLYSNTNGSFNTANGYQSLLYNTTGSNNTANGYQSLYFNKAGGYNTANGLYSLYSNTDGSFNTANGIQSLYSNKTGAYNTANGYYSLYSNTNGDYNTAFGHNAGRYQADGATALATANNSIYLGAGARGFNNNDNNTIVIGYNAIGLGANTAVLGNSSITKTVLQGNVGIGTTTPGTILSLGTGANFINLSNTAISTFAKGVDIKTGCFSVNGVCLSSGVPLPVGAAGQTLSYVGTVLTATSTLTILPNGKVGIGTANPLAKLHIETGLATTNGLIIKGFTSQSAHLQEWQNSAGVVSSYFTSDGGGLVLGGGGANGSFYVKAVNGSNWFTVIGGAVSFNTQGGNTVIGSGVSGSPARVNIGSLSSASIPLAISGVSGQTGDLLRVSTNGGTGDKFIIKSSGDVGIGTAVPGYKLDVQGTARISSDLTVEGKVNFTGAADVAEEFSTSENYAAGTVLVMGDNGYRSARASSKAYDTTVIGVVSDNPAIIMGKAVGENKAIVAIAGVIKVKVTDSNGKIRKGDLLTTSAIIGYAMKATENKMGTIIGKALEDLKGNRGEIMTLINLQ